jgi:uncharacterized protein (TIGR00255 family)
MLQSMTGFISKTLSLTLKDEPVSITVIIKALNSRFFELTCKMPHGLAHLEQSIQKKLKEKLGRGSVSFTIYMSTLTPLTGTIHPSMRTIEEYLQSIKLIQKHFGKELDENDQRISLKDLIQLPSVFEQPEAVLSKQSTDMLIDEIDKLIDALVIERKREGAALQKDLENRIQTLKITIKELIGRADVVLQKRREKLHQETLELLKSASPEAQEHHLQQMHAQLEKMDIHEEIVRFETHLQHLEEFINIQQAEKGKKIDFILQELFRETNTIAAKCLDAHLSALTITIKVELEKAREQAQNIV